MCALTDKFMLFGEISSRFQNEEKPILVGGSAVELYTKGAYRSYDIDVLAKESLEPVLEEMGFVREGRFFINPSMPEISLEIVGSSTKEKVETIKLLGEKEYDVRIISVEDLAIDRLNACKFWKSNLDCELVRLLLRGYYKKMDRGYLEDRAREEGVKKLLDKQLKNAGLL